MMRSLFLDNAPEAQPTLAGSVSEAALGYRCDALIAYKGLLGSPPEKLIFFTLELATDHAAQIIAYQRLLADIFISTLGEGFSRAGAHILYMNERISFVDFGRGDGFVNTRIGLYLPADSASSDKKLSLSALRLPNPINVWVPIVLEKAVQEFEDMAAATFALKLAQSRMRD
jgi:hypothetical protein